MSRSPSLAHRAALMPASPIRRLAPVAAQARSSGRRILGLNIGQPDIETPPVLLSRLRSWGERNIPYGPSQGLPELVEALVGYYSRLGYPITTEEIFVTTGGSEAMLFVLGAIADAGDEVVVFEPFYTNYSGFAAMAGVIPVAVQTHAADGYHLPERRAIEAALTQRTRAIIVCSPNNPTGTVYTPDEMRLLADLCRERGLFLVADEVYREFVYDGARHCSALELEGIRDRVIVVDSLSKRYSFCGARVGAIVSRNRELMETVLRFGQARLCPPTLGQWAAAALAEVPDSYLRRIVSEFEARRDAVCEALARMPGVVSRKPEGAFYLCPRIPVDDAERFAVFLLKEFHVDGETIMVAPADGFYATPGLGRDEIRIAYVLRVEDLSRAMRILAAALDAYPGRASVGV